MSLGLVPSAVNGQQQLIIFINTSLSLVPTPHVGGLLPKTVTFDHFIIKIDDCEVHM